MTYRYEDFEVIITKQGDQLYADLGVAPGSRHLSQHIPIKLSGESRTACIEALQHRKSEAELAKLGHQLFDALITGDLAENWYACLGELRQQPDIGLRLRFSYQAEALTQIPFELLCEETEPTRKFLALTLKTPVVRSPRYGGSVQERPTALPLRMLVVVANPRLHEQIDPVAEQASLEKALANLVESRTLMIDYLGLPGHPDANYDTLRDTLRHTDYPYDILHCIGHGALPEADDKEAEGILLLVNPADGRRQPDPVRASDLANILADSGVRVAILQACEGAYEGTYSAFQGVAQQLVARGVPAVLAVQCAVDKDVATWFCHQLYNSWLSRSGLPIEYAVTEARQSVRHRFADRMPAWWAPVLFIRQEGTEVLKVKWENAQSFSVQLKRGRVLLERDQVDQAVAELEQAYKQVPTEETRLPLVLALVNQAQVRHSEGDEGGALAACDRTLQVSPDEQAVQKIRTSIWVRRGDEAQQQGDLDAALDAYQQAGDEQKVEEVAARKQSAQEALGKAKGQPKAELSGAASEGWLPGLILGNRYEIVAKLVTTERYEIYQANEIRHAGRIVVVKRLRPDRLADKDACERFEREVAVLGYIHHEHVLRLLYDGETEDGGRYFVTEHADKRSLREYLRDRPHHKLNPIEALAIAQAVCQGLDTVHSYGIIHRDVNPGNILLFSQLDGSIRARLADFSVAYVPWRDAALAETSLLVGTHPYVSPEQLDGKTGDVQSDLYSWAVVLLEMLVGEPLWTSLRHHLKPYLVSDEGELPPSFFEGIPKAFVEILRKALRRDREHRYRLASEVRKDLDSIKPVFAIDIERHLSDGEEYARASKWQEASAEFEQGLELCKWYGEGLSGQLRDKLRMESLCAQGMMCLSEQKWQAAIEAFEELQGFGPSCLGVDIVARLKQARSGQRHQNKYQLISELEKQREWTKILRLTTDFDVNYKEPGGESVGDIRKRVLYQLGLQLELTAPERAYHEFQELYKLDPNYKDVRELCAAAAFSSGTRQDIPISWEQKVGWLEKAVEVDPDHEGGHARQLLNEARHHWAKELREDDRQAAVAQLRRISSDYGQWAEVSDMLRTLRRQLCLARIRTWFKDPVKIVEIIIAIAGLLVAIWGVIPGGWSSWLPGANDTKTATLTATATSTPTITPSFTPMPSSPTPVPSSPTPVPPPTTPVPPSPTPVPPSPTPVPPPSKTPPPPPEPPTPTRARPPDGPTPTRAVPPPS